MRVSGKRGILEGSPFVLDKSAWGEI